jgi:hypothetical protein
MTTTRSSYLEEMGVRIGMTLRFLGIEDRGGEHVGEDGEERGNHPGHARLDVVKCAERSCELQVRV